MTNPNLPDRDSYIREQNTREVMRENQALRENDSAATGLVVGILLAGLTALAVGAYFLTQKPTVAPTKTIIERTKEVPSRPQAQPQAPNVNVTVPNPPAPNVNVTVPNPPVNAPASSNPAPAPVTPDSTAPSNSTAPNSTDPSNSTAPNSATPANP